MTDDGLFYFSAVYMSLLILRHISRQIYVAQAVQ